MKNINFFKIDTKSLTENETKVYYELYNEIYSAIKLFKQKCKEFKHYKLGEIITLVVYEKITLFDSSKKEDSLIQKLIFPYKDFDGFKRRVLFEELYNYLKQKFPNHTQEQIDEMKGIELLEIQ